MFDQAAIHMNFGQKLAMDRLDGVNLNAGYGHDHPYYEFYYLLEGERIFVIDGNIVKLHKNDFVLIKPNVNHFSYGEKDVAFDRMLVYFTDDILSSDLIKSEIAMLLNSGYHATDSTLIRQGLLDLYNHNLQTTNAIEEENIKLLFNVILINTIKQKQNKISKHTDMMVLKIIAYIDQNYDKDLSLDDLSTLVFMDKYYMCKKFKKLTSYTIYDYLNTTRITVAEKRLMETDKTITEIGQEVGYNNISSFNRAFKNKKGVSPSHFRKSHYAKSS